MPLRDVTFSTKPSYIHRPGVRRRSARKPNAVVLASVSAASTMPVLEMLFLVRKELLSAGDQKFPFIHYTTEGEMASSEDDEILNTCWSRLML
jgi:hypothetical protein